MPLSRFENSYFEIEKAFKAAPSSVSSTFSNQRLRTQISLVFSVIFEAPAAEEASEGIQSGSELTFLKFSPKPVFFSFLSDF